MGLGEDGVARHLAEHLPSQGVKEGQAFNFIVEELHSEPFPIAFRRVDINHVTANPIGAPGEVEVVPGVLHIGQAPKQRTLLHAIAAIEVQHHF